MSEETLLDRKQLAAAVGMHPSTFWRKLLEYNRDRRRDGLDGLSPDKIITKSKVPKFYFKAERAPAFKAAVESLPTNKRGRPLAPSNI